MKQPFNNAGFAKEQARVINLPQADLLAEVIQIRTQFVPWMQNTFALSPSQDGQLLELDSIFRQQIADAVADSWEMRNVILFYKEERPDVEAKDDKSAKDYVLEHFDITSQRSDSPATHTSSRVSIRIVYR